jgi:hypothetical protein
MGTEQEHPIACTLQGGTYQDRLAWIAQLADDGLLGHERRDLVLELQYRAEVADRVREMVAKEQHCCGFLRFEIRETAEDIRVTISAPERARAEADDIFQQFIPTTGNADPALRRESAARHHQTAAMHSTTTSR